MDREKAGLRTGPQASRLHPATWRRKMRLGVALAAGCALLATAAARPSPSFGSSTPRCSTSNLILSFVRSLGATSHQFWDLSLRNGGSTTCHLEGYPGVGLLDSRARLINVPVKRMAGFKVRNVVLAPWQRAFFSFGYVVSGPCLPHFFSAYGIEVFPPDSGQRLLLYEGRFDICSPSVGGNPVVYPVRPTLEAL